MGLAGSASAFAATKHKPVVKAVSASAGTTAGGATVIITGKYFKSGGKSVVKKVTFGTRTATGVHVVSATKITATTPAGKGIVDVRVVTKAGGKSAKVKADRYTYRTATQIAVKAGDAQTASAGAAVAIAPSVVVTDAKGKPVPGVTVTFAVATGGGSVTGSPAKTDASGIAAVGSWKLGAVVGANTLTATSAGLTGSPVTFTATGGAGVLQVQHNGTAVRAYSLDELKALTPFAGYAGLNKSPIVGPDAVTGVKVLDVVKDALGTPLASGQSVVVAEVDATPYSKTMTYDLLANFAGVSMYDTSKVLVPSPVGPLAAILIYGDTAGNVMPAASGPLRFAVADATEQLVFGPTSLSVSKVNQLNVVTP
jgi:large repetitive protein